MILLRQIWKIDELPMFLGYWEIFKAKVIPTNTVLYVTKYLMSLGMMYLNFPKATLELIKACVFIVVCYQAGWNFIWQHPFTA